MMTSLWSTRSSWARIDTKCRPSYISISCLALAKFLLAQCPPPPPHIPEGR